MAKISHFVVTYNHETKELEYDVDTTVSRFSDGWIYNEETEEWTNSEDITDYENDVVGEDILIDLLRESNKNRLEPNG